MKKEICANKGCNNSVETEYAIVGGEKVCISCVKKIGWF